MAVRFYSLHYSQSGKKYEVKILDNTLGVSTNYDINWGDNSGVTISRKGGSPEKFNRIVPTSCELVLQILNTDDQDFYDDLIASYEGRFFMEVNYQNPLTLLWTNIFKGHILSDISSIADKYQPEFSITAVDGLEGLSRVDYYGDPVPNLQKTVTEHVGRILNSLPITELYDSFQPMYKFAVDLRDENHDVSAVFASDTRVRNYFYEKKDGIKVFKKMYDVLHEFLTMINARIYFSEGVFCIDQLGYRGANETVQYDIYNTDRTYNSTSSSQDELSYMLLDDITADAHPTITTIAPVNQVTVIQEGEFLSNILLGKEWNKDDATPEVTTAITEINGKDRIFLTFDLYHYMESTRLSILPNTTVRPVAWMSLEIDIQIDDGVNIHYYTGLYKGVFYDNQHEYKIAINTVYVGIVRVPIKIIIPISRLPPANTNIKPDLNKIPVVITTPTVQHTGDVTVNVSNMELWTDQTITTPLVLDPIYKVSPNTNEVYWWEATNAVFAIGQTLEDAVNTSNRVTTLINDSRNNINIEEKMSMGTFPNITTLQKLEIYDGASWIDSTGWKGTGDTTYHRLAVQVIRDIIKLRKLPSKLIEISWWDKHELFHSYERLINYKGEKFIWLDWTHTTDDDTVRGSLWQLINASADDVPTVIEVETEQNMIGLPPGFTTTGDPPISDENGETNFVDNDNVGDEFYNEYTMSGSSQVINGYDGFPDNSVYTMKSINHSIKIYIGSTHYHIVDKDIVDLANTECQLDYDTTTVNFSRDLTGRLMRFDAKNKYRLNPVTA